MLNPPQRHVLDLAALVPMESGARHAHLVNFGLWPIFMTILLTTAGRLSQNPDLGERNTPNRGANPTTQSVRLEGATDGSSLPSAASFFISFAGVYACLQWGISIAQTRRRYKRLWRRLRLYEIGPSYDDPDEYSIRLGLSFKREERNSIWKLRGESLPYVLGLLFVLIPIAPVFGRGAQQIILGSIALAVLFGLLVFEAYRLQKEHVRALYEDEGLDMVSVADDRSNDGVPFRVITLGNSKKGNRLSLATLRVLRDAVRENPDQIVILRASGGVFCNGLNVYEMTATGSSCEHVSAMKKLIYSMWERKSPVVSIVGNEVKGGGLALAYCTHYSFTKKGTRLEVPFDKEYEPLVRFLIALLKGRRSSLQEKSLSPSMVVSATSELVDDVFEGDDEAMILRALEMARSLPQNQPDLAKVPRDAIEEAAAKAISQTDVGLILDSLKKRKQQQSAPSARDDQLCL